MKAQTFRPTTPMETYWAIARELKAVERMLKRRPANRAELYAAQQALSWVLGRDAMKPSQCFQEAEQEPK